MKVLALRDNATCENKNGVFLFNGVSGSEFLNTRRTTPMLPPKHDLEVKADTIYKIYTGLAYELSDSEHPNWCLPDVRPTTPYWRNHGVRIERVEFEERTPGVQELVIYITTIVQFNLKPMDRMFESFSLGRLDAPEMFVGELPNKAEGFVPNAKRSITDASVRRGPADGSTPAVDASDDEKRKKMDAWLNEPDEKPGQTVAPGAPAGAIPRVGISAAPEAAAKVVEKGGVRAATPDAG